MAHYKQASIQGHTDEYGFFFFLEIDEYGSILSDRQMPLIDIYYWCVAVKVFLEKNIFKALF